MSTEMPVKPFLCVRPKDQCVQGCCSPGVEAALGLECCWRVLWAVWSSLVAQTVKHLSTVREAYVRSLSQEDPLEKEMAAHSRILAWKIPWTVEPGRLLSMGSQRVGHD